MGDSQTIIECDQCGAFRGWDSHEPLTSHNCVTGLLGTEEWRSLAVGHEPLVRELWWHGCRFCDDRPCPVLPRRE